MKLVTRLTAATAVAIAAAALAGFSTPTKAAPAVKAVICHAAGGKYVGINVSVGSEDPSKLSNNGHLDENGSPLSGHEQDLYLGLGFEKSDCDKLPPPK